MSRLTDGTIYTFGDKLESVEMAYVEKVQKKLASYEDAEEQGLLLRLPCKVGDEVWEANGFWKMVLKRTVAVIALSSGNHIYIRNGCGDSFEFGVDVFLTKAEAEKALKEMENAT